MPKGAHHPSPAVVGICAWLVPGLGYFILGQRARGITVAITLFLLFAFGILIGGIRVVDPPGWGQYGYKVQLVERPSSTIPERVDPASPKEEEKPEGDKSGRPLGWALTNQFFAEIGNKPWFVGQMFCGPISFLMSAVSIHEAHPLTDPTTGLPIQDPKTDTYIERVPASHSRSWEIGTLYTAVAGMLNLLAIIDSTYRAGQEDEQ